ncbi:MAG: leucine--tRNA ligase [Planctomycetes bacterium]|nr:leucine--tRNA ligase [Planctomycetota bacterium]
MGDRYDFTATERKWQERWDALGLFLAPEKPRPDRAFYLLEMFAYPSGDLHMGHFRNYGIGDAVGRFLLMNGKDVLHPFGWDAFGLPAEGAAIKRGVHPRDWTLGNIAQSKSTLKAMGIAYDWSREITTCLPDYYKFTQWMFLLLHRRGLVYRKNAPVNWCGTCNTVLANEQVEQGTCWRCHNPVAKRELEQWYVRITDYAQRLLDGLDTLPQWPASTLAAQRNWIGRSEGAEIRFAAPGPAANPISIEVFTTRPDTLWGVTFLSVAPESEIGRRAAATAPNAAAVAAYAAEAERRTEIERTAADREKTGVATGWHVAHPCTGAPIPVYVADYVLATYGTGAVMGVPAHDERDFVFARKMGLPLQVVVLPPTGAEGFTGDVATWPTAWTAPGVMTASAPFDGRHSDEAIPAIVAWLAEQGFGRPKVTFKLRDWLISRQRYWGCPIPMIHCATCGVVPVPDEQLPVLLPETITNWIPKGRSPLADVPEFVATTCPKCGAAAQRDVDTMDTFIDSSWYHLRYVDPRNTTLPCSREAADAWLPIDLYIGGPEHANGHCLYFRFFTKVMKDAGYIDVDEPAVRLFHHGMVLDPQGRRMSKSLGNLVSPIDMMREFGSDASRIAMFFFAPSDAAISWSEDGVQGAKKLVQRVFDLVTDFVDVVAAFPVDVVGAPSSSSAKDVRRAAHEVLRRFDSAFRGDLALNTGIAAVYELLNLFPKAADVAAWSQGDRATVAESIRLLVKALAPVAPHLCEELHERLGGTGSVFREAWPTFDPAALRRDEVEIAVQVNGKIKARVTVATGATDAAHEAAAMTSDVLLSSLGGKTAKRVVVVKGRLVNFIV